MITVEGEIAYANARAASLFGASSMDVLRGESVGDVVSPGDRNEVLRRIDTAQCGQSTEPYEHRVTGLDRKERVVRSRSVPVQYEGDAAALSVIRNVTSWHEAQNGRTQRAELEHLIVEISAEFIERKFWRRNTFSPWLCSR